MVRPPTEHERLPPTPTSAEYVRLREQLDRIERKCDEMLVFRDLVMRLAGPWLSSRAGRLMARRGGRGEQG